MALQRVVFSGLFVKPKSGNLVLNLFRLFCRQFVQSAGFVRGNHVPPGARGGHAKHFFRMANRSSSTPATPKQAGTALLLQSQKIICLWIMQMEGIPCGGPKPCLFICTIGGTEPWCVFYAPFGHQSMSITSRRPCASQGRKGRVRSKLSSSTTPQHLLRAFFCTQANSHVSCVCVCVCNSRRVGSCRTH